MAISYVGGDISTSDNVSSVTGVSWTGLGHVAGDYAFSIWALVTTATGVVQDSDLTTIEDHTDQNLRSFYSRRTMTGSESGAVSYMVDAGSLNRMAVALAIYRGVGSLGTPVRFTEGGTAVEKHPAANNLSYTPTADNALILLVYSERSSTGNTAGTLTPPTHIGTGTPATIRRERGTGSSGGVYVCIAEFQLGAGTAGVTQTFTQWDATPDTLVASNVDMWLQALYPVAAAGVTFAAPSEADVAVALVQSKSLTLGLPAESDAALAFTRSKAIALGVTAEADAALPVAATRGPAALAVPTESDTARAIGLTKSVTLAVATETDEARAIDVSSVVGVELATAAEAETAHGLTSSKQIVLGVASEIDSASLLNCTKTAGLGAVTEVDAATALLLSSQTQISLAGTTEADAAPALSAAKTVSFGRPVEADGAGALVATKTIVLGTAAEVNAAFALIVGETAPAIPGHLVATNHGSLLTASNSSALTATDTSASRLEASHDL